MGNFGWVDSLVGEPGVNIQRLTTKGLVVIVITSGGYMSVFQRTREARGFGRVSKRRQRQLLEKIRENNPRVESITI